jgi:hypothetical protein
MPDKVCPKYRIRLFMSVDLTGSTAFKANHSEPDPEVSPNPIWVDQIRHFYRTFPSILKDEFARALAGQDQRYECHEPEVWKTIGDEIVFCCRLQNLQHLVACILSFKQALKKYGLLLEDDELPLDVKGYAWVAAFPSPNVTVTTITDQDLWDENSEAEADEEPGMFDFLGKEIDAGFRASRFCTPDKVSVSLELAHLLSDPIAQEIMPTTKFLYEGRQHLKGVIKDKPYPVFLMYVERSQRRREVHESERMLMQTNDFTALQMRNFTALFMSDTGIEPPVLRSNGQVGPHEELPKSYRDYVTNWNAAFEEYNRRAATEAQAINVQDGTDEIPYNVSAILSKDLATE